VNDQLEDCEIKRVSHSIKVLFQRLPGGTEENHEDAQTE
jgi:hypothetical protein